MIKKSLIILLILISYSLEAAVSLEVFPNPVQMGQTVTLTLTEVGTTNASTPLLTPLEADFEIVGTAKSSNYSIINGQASSSNQWTIVLMPKTAGKLVIPSIQLGNEKTTPQSIEVLGANTANKSENDEVGFNTDRDLMLLTEVSNSKPFLNEEVMYTVKFYKKVDLLDAAYEHPTINDALLIPLGHGRRYYETKGSQVYTVEEQKYAIFPEKSGLLTINAPQLQALVFRQRPEKIRVTTHNTTLNAQAIPANYQGTNWIPARGLQLSEFYDKTVNKLSEGATLVRTITLRTSGLPAELLPDINFEKNQNFSVYQEKTILKNQLKNNAILGTKTFKLTYLLNKSGNIEIPAVELSWFNTQSKQQETATLPMRSIVVEGTVSQENTKPIVSVEPVELKDSKNIIDIKDRSKPLNQTVQSNWGYFVLALVFAFLWLITILLWWKWPHLFSKRKGKIQKELLREACLNNQPQLAKKALIAWAKAVWPDETILDLADIMRLIDDGVFKGEIKGLIDAIYQQKPKPWQGHDLWKSFKAYHPKTRAVKKKDVILPPTNPK